jgi:hypothetical protein
MRCARRSGLWTKVVWLAVGWLSAGGWFAPAALAQDRSARTDPSALLIPNAPPRPGGDRRVCIQVGEAEIVAKVYVEVGDRFVVLAPNGQLLSVPIAQAAATDEPFKPATKEQMSAALAKQFPGFKTRQTRRYLYVYNCSEPFYTGASQILETMYPGLHEFFRRQRIAVHDPDTPLVVIVFRTQDEFDRYRAMPDGVVAYYDNVTNHVVMYEQSRLLEVAPDLAMKQSISTIAHEGVHQILHNIGVQQRLSRWPLWLSEGLAEYFAPTSVDRRVRWKGVAQVNDLRMKELESYLKQRGGASPSGETIQRTVAAEGLTSTGYAAAWALTHFLGQRRKEQFTALLKDASSRGPLEQDSPDRGGLDLFTRHFGSDLGPLEQAMIKHLQGLPYVDPLMHQTHYVVVLEVNTGTGVQRTAGVTTSPAAVRQWQQEALGNVPANLRAAATFTVRAYPSKAEADRVARSWLGRP